MATRENIKGLLEKMVKYEEEIEFLLAFLLSEESDLEALGPGLEKKVKSSFAILQNDGKKHKAMVQEIIKGLNGE